MYSPLRQTELQSKQSYQMPVNKIHYMDKREVMSPHWQKKIMETFKDKHKAVVHRFTPYVSIAHGKL